MFWSQNVAFRDFYELDRNFYEPDRSLYVPDRNLYEPDRNLYEPDRSFYEPDIFFTVNNNWEGRKGKRRRRLIWMDKYIWK